MLRSFVSQGLILSLSVFAVGCTTIPAPSGSSSKDTGQNDIGLNEATPSQTGKAPKDAAIVVAEPLPAPPIVVEIFPPPAPVSQPPVIEIFEQPKWYDALTHWHWADLQPALTSFKRSCKSFSKADPEANLNPNLPEYGRYDDWQPACDEALFVSNNSSSARQFFETEFEPTSLSTAEGETGLLTGYYEPEISVRKFPDNIYSEPVLAKPTNKDVLSLARADINAYSSRVIAYGKPIDVFFMQVQGSGRLKYTDGTSVRAAYAGNNGKRYKSIGKVLVDRGEMTLAQASKQAINDWMEREGPQATRQLMNENPRYIFFTEQAITPGEGPRGGMRVPLTDMGSIAVDRSYHPYGTLVWLETTLPQFGGDFRGQETGLLVSVQDTGNAIRGPLRGDLFFGSGDNAGDRAGVMKHPVKWTILVPKALAARLRTSS